MDHTFTKTFTPKKVKASLRKPLKRDPRAKKGALTQEADTEKQKLSFPARKELRQIFTVEYDKWRKRHRAGLQELGDRCGLSASYLSQIGRYGRVPSRSVLILLGMNFEMKEPQQLFEAAGIRERFPYEPGVCLRRANHNDEGFVQLRIDMDGLTSAIRDVIRSEVKHRSIKDLLGSRPLRIGHNNLKSWLYKGSPHKGQDFQGFFPEICEMLGLSLQVPILSELIEYSTYAERLMRHEVDVFGPVVTAPKLVSGVVFSDPLYKVGMSALMRKRKTSEFLNLPAPRSAQDLLNKDYRIAVFRNSRGHLLANTRFRRSDSELVLCHTMDEAVERLVLSGIKNSAHILICNAVDAKIWHKEHPRELAALFVEADEFLDLAETGFAIRSDWPELLASINSFIDFIKRTHSLQPALERWMPSQAMGLLKSAEY